MKVVKIFADALVDTLVNGHRLQGTVTRQESDSHLIGSQVRLFQEALLVSLQEVAGQNQNFGLLS